MVHSTALNSSDNLPTYLPDNHHSSDDVYWREGGLVIAVFYICWLSYFRTEAEVTGQSESGVEHTGDFSH